MIHEDWTENSEYVVRCRHYPTMKEHVRIEPTDGRGRFDQDGIGRLSWAIVEIIQRVRPGEEQKAKDLVERLNRI